MSGRGGAGVGEDAGWIRTNRGVAACIAGAAILLLIYLGTSEWALRELRDGFRLGFFTAVAVFAMLLCAVAMMLDRHRHETDEDIARLTRRDWLVAVVALALCYACFELAWRVDFLLVAPVFLAGGMWTLGVRPLRSAVLAAVLVAVVIYVLFRLIGIALPTNVIGL